MPTYPYTSGPSAIVQAFAQLRKGFPSKVDAGYLQRFGIAPANESYIISILRFLDLIDDEGVRRDEDSDFFFGGDEVFRPGLDERVRAAYARVFEEMGEEALTAERDVLANWFRASDKTSALVGQRQAATFQVLVGLAGHGDMPSARASRAKKTAGLGATANKPAAKASSHSKPPGEKTSRADPRTTQGTPNPAGVPDVGLTVRIEVNLPPAGDAQTYDAIFASIKKHLMT